MSEKTTMVVDGNEATASVAYRLSEVIAIYPITPSSNMGEWSDEWAARQYKNIWGAVPTVAEMQSEGGAAGAIHGAIQAGALGTSFTASQGLLLKIPNMYKIAGELTPFVLHVSARALASHALSIFGDHSDIMGCRMTGFAMLGASSVQEAHDMALIAHSATLKARVPFLHFFDGFRTSHEVTRIEKLSDDDLRAFIDDDLVKAHRERALTPDRPLLRGTAQNPDVFFQAREACNLYYDNCPDIVEKELEKFGKHTGRNYKLFEYHGAPDAESVIVIMGSGVLTAREAAKALNAKGEKVGVLGVRLYRPFASAKFLAALPKTVKRIAVMDRTKEPGATGDPLFLDVMATIAEGWQGAMPLVVAGRYGLSSKEFTPSMVKAIYKNLSSASPKRRFTIGIVDDVTHLSLDVNEDLDVLTDVHQALFYGLGSDGTVGANKNTIKIVGTETELQAQGYFVYDSKKSGTITVSHVRFGKGNLDAPYLIEQANFIGCHQWEFVDQIDMLAYIREGGTLLLNSPYSPEDTWKQLPVEMAQQIIDKKVQLYIIDAYKVATDAGLGRRTNTVMQTCYFALANVLETEKAVASIKKTIEYTYGKKGAELVRKNVAAVDQAIANMKKFAVPSSTNGHHQRPPIVTPNATDFVKRVSGVILAGKGHLLPVSAFPVDGTWPTATSQFEKRNINLEIPVWDENICIQCNKCAMVCPHAAIRAKVYDDDVLAKAPAGWKSTTFKAEPFKGKKYTLQVAAEDCTGCKLCVEVCPAKDKSNPRHKSLNMELQRPIREAEREKFSFFLTIPEVDRKIVKLDVKGSQLLRPLFEFSGACPGCGETPYIKLMTQLFGDRALIANATGCSSIYGGNLPTTPYAMDENGRGPAWSNSLFEDNAEFGFGFRLSVDAHNSYAKILLQKLAPQVGDVLVDGLLGADQTNEAGIEQQRARVVELKKKLAALPVGV